MGGGYGSIIQIIMPQLNVRRHQRLLAYGVLNLHFWFSSDADA